MPKATIMVAEDDRSFRDLLALALGAQGFQVIPTGTTHEALAILHAQPVNLILLDVKLADGNGLEILSEVRRQPNGQHLPVVLLTAHADRATVLEAARLGIQGYILKTELSRSNLLARVESFLKAPPATPAVSNAVGGAKTAPAKPRPPVAPAVPLLLADAAEKLREIKPISSRADVLAELDKCTGLKALSPTVTQLLSMTDRPDCSLEEIARVIKRDPAIALKILKMANSVVYNRGGLADTVQKALSRIGLTQVRQVVLNFSVIDSFHAGGLGEYFDSRSFWEHSISVGLIAAAITRFRNADDRAIDAAFTSGLVHDVARMVFAEQFGDLYRQVLETAAQQQLPLELVETRMLQCNHADVMQRVLKAWAFPDRLLEPIAVHHMPIVSMRKQSPQKIMEVATLGLADRLAHSMLLGSSGNDCQYSTDEFVEILSLDSDSIKTLEDRIPEEANDMKCAMLQMSSDTAWPDRADIVRKQFKKPFKPLFVSPAPEVDGHRMMCKRLTDPAHGNTPTVAIVHMSNPRGASALAKTLEENEKICNVPPLPVIVITSDLTQPISDNLTANRPHEILPSPFSLTSLVDLVNRLLAA